MMLLGKADQVIQADLFSVIGEEGAAIDAKHLVHLTIDDPQVGGGGAVFKGGENGVIIPALDAEALQRR